MDEQQKQFLWTVLEESPEDTGYTIFYDEEENMFGLGMKLENGNLMNIGYYGTFLKTLKSM